MRVLSTLWLALWIVVLVQHGEAHAQPMHASYQGELVVAGSPYSGSAQFKFALVIGGVNTWSNDGTLAGEPTQAVTLQVVDGIFSVRLGDVSIPGITGLLLPEHLQATSAVIRVWVNTGSGFIQLPDVPISSSPFALQAESAKRAVSGFSVEGNLQVFEDSGERTLYVNADEGTTGALVIIYDLDSGGQARQAIELDSREGSGGGLIRLFNGIEGGPNPNQATVEINAQEGTGPGQITLFDNQGNVAIQLDAEMSDGFSRVITDIVQINGGMDVAERFEIEGPEEEIRPGSVVSISAEVVGSLVVSSAACDTRVAGIVSGAGGVNVGMILGQEGMTDKREYPVALTGRVYCLADASYGAIEAGDLLTTSATAGHAMKVTDHDRARGAIIGKAMSSLAEGTGLVFVLVSLQ